MNTTTVAAGLLVFCTAYQASTAGQSVAPPAAPTQTVTPATGVKPIAQDSDKTLPYRRPGALVAACGAATVKDLGLWPDMQAAFERGEVLEIINLPLAGSINARGQTIVPLAGGPANALERPEKDGLVQYNVKSRPSAGRINARGDVMGALYIDNPEAGAAQPLLQKTFIFPADAASPIAVDVPAGMRLDITGLTEKGLGIGNLFQCISDPALPPDGPYFVELNRAKNSVSLRPVIDRAKLPPGLLNTSAWSINSKNEVLLNLSRDTGERSHGMFIDKNGKQQITCPNIIGAVSQCAVVRGDTLEVVPLPDGIASMSGYVLLDDGTIVGCSEKDKASGSPSTGFVWRSGHMLELRGFDMFLGSAPSDVSDGLVCGQANIPDSAMGKPAKQVEPAQREAFYALRCCGVLWDLRSGAMLPLDSLLPTDSACAHITAAGAIRGNKLLCRGLINGKEHGLIITLPDKVREGFAPGQ